MSIRPRGRRRLGVVGVLAAAAVLCTAVAATGAGPAPAATTSYDKVFVPLSEQAKGVLYRQSAPTPAASVGVVLMHPNSDFENALACDELAARGFTALCVAGRYVNTNREDMVWEDVPLDLAPAVAYLRHLPGIRKVVLVGHSGGGQLMPFYENVAENGVAACQRPARIVKCTDALAGLPRADGLVLLDAHHGYGANTLTSLDGAVRDETDPGSVEPALDLFSARNGYTPEAPGGPRYSPAFQDRYLAAQADREARLVQAAYKAVTRTDNGNGAFPDDQPFPVYRTDARLWQCDVSLVSHTKGRYPVLRADGSARVEVARTVRVPSCDPDSDASFASGAVQYSARAFLSSQTIRTTGDYDITDDDIRGISWESSNTSTPANIEGVSVPTLIMAMTGHYWMVSSEIFYRHSPATDKELSFVEGASHGFTPCTACESRPGQFGDTVKTTFDHVAAWLTTRYVR